MKITRFIHSVCAALAMCFGSFAFAAVDPVEYGYTLSHALADAGAYGAESAYFAAVQADMLSNRIPHSTDASGLLKASHGFMQLAADEVAKGTTGSTVSLTSNLG